MHASLTRGGQIAWRTITTVSYVFHNRRRIDYATYRQAGYLVGTGAVESACKLTIQERMKQGDMHWDRNGAQAIFAPGSTLLNDRWDAVSASSLKVPCSPNSSDSPSQNDP
jgi:hypothetical protein